HQHQLAVLVDRDLAARVAIHAHLANLAVQLIFHVVTDQFLAGIGHRVAAGFGGGIGVTLLHALLDLVAGVAAADRTSHSGDLLAVTAAHLVTEQATGQGADHSTGDLVLILDR